MILDHENGDFFGSLEGYEEVDYSSKEEKKNRKAGLLNWFKSRVCIFLVIYDTLCLTRASFNLVHEIGSLPFS